MGAAMAMVRDELGPDALILTAQSIEGGVEVTAAQDPSPAPEAPVEDEDGPPDLLWQGLPPALTTRLTAQSSPHFGNGENSVELVCL